MPNILMGRFEHGWLGGEVEGAIAAVNAAPFLFGEWLSGAEAMAYGSCSMVIWWVNALLEEGTRVEPPAARISISLA